MFDVDGEKLLLVSPHTGDMLDTGLDVLNSRGVSVEGALAKQLVTV